MSKYITPWRRGLHLQESPGLKETERWNFVIIIMVHLDFPHVYQISSN